MKEKKQLVSHLFQIQLQDTQLKEEDVARIATALRRATTKELLKMDFRIQELTPLFRKGDAGALSGSCGGGCRAGSAVVAPQEAKKGGSSPPRERRKGAK